MTFSTLLRISLLTLLGVTCVVCTTSDAGGGSLVSFLDKKIDFNKYALENEGRWDFQMVPKTDFYKNVKRMWLVNKKTSTDGVYKTTIRYKTKSGKTKTLLNEKGHSIANGQATATIKDKNGNEEKFKLSFVKYEESKYIFYHVSQGDDGKKKSEDRFVLVHKDLDEKSLQSIKKIDQKLGFQTELQKIDLRCN